MARRHRRRQIEEALDEERGREAALAERLEEVVTEHEGPLIDERAFAGMQPEYVALVRDALEAPSLFDEDEDDLDADLLGVQAEELDRDDLEEEVERLQAEIADSRSRQLAFRRYLEALESQPGAGGPPE
jgi:hypothetical protein